MRTIARPVDETDLMASIVAAMLAAGWTNAGAPTTTILSGAADSEGRRPYVRLYTLSSPQVVELEIGHGRSGDTIVMPGTMPINGGRLYWEAQMYQIFATDRWIFVEQFGSADAVLVGMLESPYNVATFEAPLLMARNFALGSAARTSPNLIKSGDSLLFVPNDPLAPTAWWRITTGLLGFWASSAVGTRYLPACEKQYFRGRSAEGMGGPVYPTMKWWWCQHTGTGYIVGYVKDVYLAFGLFDDSDFGTGQPVQIGNRIYYRAGHDASASMLGHVKDEYCVWAVLPGELA